MACEANIFEGNSRDVRLEKLYFKYITWCRETSPYARFFYFLFQYSNCTVFFWVVCITQAGVDRNNLLRYTSWMQSPTDSFLAKNFAAKDHCLPEHWAKKTERCCLSPPYLFCQ